MTKVDENRVEKIQEMSRKISIKLGKVYIKEIKKISNSVSSEDFDITTATVFLEFSTRSLCALVDTFNVAPEKHLEFIEELLSQLKVETKRNLDEKELFSAVKA